MEIRMTDFFTNWFDYFKVTAGVEPKPEEILDQLAVSDVYSYEIFYRFFFFCINCRSAQIFGSRQQSTIFETTAHGSTENGQHYVSVGLRIGHVEIVGITK